MTTTPTRAIHDHDDDHLTTMTLTPVTTMTPMRAMTTTIMTTILATIMTITMTTTIIQGMITPVTDTKAMTTLTTCGAPAAAA